MQLDPSMHGRFRLPGAGLADVEHPRQRELLARVLAREGLRPEEFKIEGVPGFQLKGEDRELVLRPGEIDLTASPHGLRLSFDLTRGAYALLVVRRILADVRTPDRSARKRPPRPPAAGKNTRKRRP
jgi:tRNA(Glu) U13 pseudouridine synthase TruD